MNKNAKWNEHNFLKILQAQEGVEVANVAKKILKWVQKNEFKIVPGKLGKKINSGVQIQYNGHSIISPKISGKATIWFHHLHSYTIPFKEDQKTFELLNMLNEIEGISIPREMVTKEPGIQLSVFINESSLEKFLEIIEWVKLELKNDDIGLTKTIKSVDLEEPPQRIKSEVIRIIRDTYQTISLKKLHDYKCQLCDMVIQLPDGSRYIEAHHIKPLGSGHEGPDIRKNIMIVCPNHHAMLDLGAIRLAIGNISPGHEIGSEFIDYHNNVIYKGTV